MQNYLQALQRYVSKVDDNNASLAQRTIENELNDFAFREKEMKRYVQLKTEELTKKIKEFYSKYSIDEESLQTKYKTKAALHYRLQLRCESDNIPFNEQPPQYDQGREIIPDEA